uniref:Si:ch211-93g21.1 n=2 Tax=Nothobranchius korthausae TaxID=1143690 RepID=A0A1A8G5Q1_9TELE
MNQSGKMKLLLRSVLLSSLCTLSSWSVSSEALVVSQSPDVSVSEGETVTVTCCWGNKTRVHVSWLKDQTLIRNETVNIQSQKSPNQLRNCTVLSFQGITRNDSGRYVCKVIVEIPILTSVEGNGTTITVTAGRNRTDNPTGGVSSEALVVSQSPDVSVSEGETVTVTCCWGNKTRVHVSWLKDQTLIRNETVNIQSQKSPNQLRNCTVLSFQGITRNDSGRYVCKVIVEIPILTSVEGNGTTITVTAGRNRTDNPTGACKYFICS